MKFLEDYPVFFTSRSSAASVTTRNSVTASGCWSVLSDWRSLYPPAAATSTSGRCLRVVAQARLTERCPAN